MKGNGKTIFSSIFTSSLWCVGVSPDSNGASWAVVQQTSKGPVLHAHGYSKTAEEAVTHLHGITKDAHYFASVFPSLPTLCRQICLPVLSDKEAQPALVDLLEQTLAVGVEESVITYESHPNGDGSMTVMAYLTRNQALEDHLSSLKSLFDPEWVIPKAACLAAFLSHFMLNGWQYVIDIGVDETTAILVYNGQVIESRSLVGGCTVFANLNNPSPETDETLRLFLQHVAEALLAYKERYGLEEGGAVTITGSVVNYHFADHVISEFVQLPLSPLHETPDSTSLLCHAAAVGATFLLRPNSSTSPVPNFRNGTFSFKNSLLHWKRPLLALALGCLAISSVIMWYGLSESKTIITGMRNDWKAITLAAHTTPQEINAKTEKVLGLSEPLDTAPSEQLLAQGNWLLSSLEQKTPYPLHPDVPRITDVLSWLSSQISEIIHTSPESASKFEIQNIFYQLVKHPTKTHPKEHYQVRVDVEFTTPSVALARAFHDRLVSSNQCVDSCSEVKWTPSNGKYRASFFLKDKTHYPPQEQ